MRLAALILLLLLAGCGGNGGALIIDGPSGGETYTPVVQGAGMALGILKDASGAPSGIRVSWTRVDVTGVQGYYIYKATTSNALPDGDPASYSANRIPDEDADGNTMIEQFGSGTQTLTFDNHFSPPIGNTYYYRLTVVNSTGDESDFSTQLSIAIAQHTITTITTTPVGIADQVTITGTFFGQSKEATDHLYFTNQAGTTNVEAGSYVSWGPTQIVVTVPYGAADGVVGVTIAGATVYSSQSIAYIEPAISSLSPGEDWVQHNDVVISGSEFGPAPGSGGTSSYVYFGTTAAESADITSWTETEIRVKVPAAASGMTVNVKVSVASNDSNTQSFVILPHIDSLSASSGNTGASVTINGTNFGSTQGTGTVAVNGVSATVGSWNNTAIAITIPANAVDGSVAVTRSDTKVTNGVGFDVIPTISSITPLRRKVGEALTINGSGFGAARGTSTLHFNGGAVDAVTYSSWAAGQIVVVVPSGATSGTVTVNIVDNSVGSNQDSATSASSLAVVLPPPDITDIGQL